MDTVELPLEDAAPAALSVPPEPVTVVPPPKLEEAPPNALRVPVVVPPPLDKRPVLPPLPVTPPFAAFALPPDALAGPPPDPTPLPPLFPRPTSTFVPSAQPASRPVVPNTNNGSNLRDRSIRIDLASKRGEPRLKLTPETEFVNRDKRKLLSSLKHATGAAGRLQRSCMVTCTSKKRSVFEVVKSSPQLPATCPIFARPNPLTRHNSANSPRPTRTSGAHPSCQ